MSDPSLRLQFEQLLSMPASARTAWLDQQKLTPERRAQLQALLRADDESNTDFVAQTRGELRALLRHAPALAEESPLLQQQFGPYVLTQWLGRGGMASVYVGERNDGKFAQTVAVKVLRQALHTDFERRLFQREQQALAALDHPNVARLLDGGVTASGQPYLVMELVRGKTLLEHCQEQRLSLRARVALFAQVCDGVQAAHRALIVHRDIKPGNIVVSDQGQAKLLDFGVAKILRLEEDASQTQTFAPITPAYAAPEQFDGRPITTATDVYGLGMVLHELLTGVRRTQGDTTRASELLRRIQPTQARFSVSPRGETLLETVRFLQGDIDNILRKALAVDPTERYASAGELALDIERFLRGQPVAAHPPSKWYRTSKFVRRNRGVVAIATLSLVGVLASSIFAVQQAIEAHAQSAKAQLQATRAEATKDFLVRLFEVSEAGVARTEIPSTETLLREGGTRVLNGLADAPSVRIELLNVIGGVQQSLGLAADAKALAQAAVAQADQQLSVADPQWLRAHANNAQVALDEKRFLPAIAELQNAIAQADGKNLDAQVLLHALKTLALAQAMADQKPAARASADRLTALAEKSYGANSLQALEALELATEVAYQSNDLPLTDRLSSTLMVQAIARFGPLHARTLEAKIARTQYFVAALKTDQAEAMAQSAASDLAQIYPQPNDIYVTVLTALGAVQFQNSKIDACATTLERINQLYLGPLKGRPGRDRLLNNLASVRIVQLRYDEALVLNEQALALSQATYGERHSETALVLRARGQIFARLNRFAEAQATLLRAQEIFLAVDGVESALALKLHISIADLAIRQGQGAKALKLLAAALLRLRKSNPETHRDVLEARLWEARALLLIKDFEKAARLLPVIAADVSTAGTAAVYMMPILQLTLGDAFFGSGKFAAARAAYTEALRLRLAEPQVNAKAVGTLEQKLRSLRSR